MDGWKVVLSFSCKLHPQGSLCDCRYTAFESAELIGGSEFVEHFKEVEKFIEKVKKDAYEYREKVHSARRSGRSQTVARLALEADVEKSHKMVDELYQKFLDFDPELILVAEWFGKEIEEMMKTKFELSETLEDEEITFKAEKTNK